MDAQTNQFQHNQVIPATPKSCSTETGSPGLSSVNHQKHEASAHDPAAVTSKSKQSTLYKDGFVGTCWHRDIDTYTVHLVWNCTKCYGIPATGQSCFIVALLSVGAATRKRGKTVK